MSTKKLTDDQIIDVLKSVIARRGLKLPSLAKDLGLTYRTLQSYLYKRTRMPIGVYVELCARIGIPADYVLYDRFRLDYHIMQRALIATFGEILDHVLVNEDMRLTLSETKGKSRPHGWITSVLISHYDRLSETELDRDAGEEEDDDEVYQ